MDPPIGHSITYTSPDRWAIGNLWFCEKVTGPAPTDAVVTWEDGDSTFALRPQPQNHSQTPGDTKTNRVYDLATAEAAWNIGDGVICKTESWVEGLELEGDTIRVVKDRMPSIPVPEVIYYWLDRAWNRSFILTKRPSGETFEDAWPKLSTPQAEKIAADLAQHARTMSAFTSPQLKTITGCGILNDAWLFGAPEWETWPSWKPVIRPIFTPETVTTYLRDLGGVEPPDVGDAFHFYHPIMAPPYVFVSVSGAEEEDVQITAITHWSTAGYSPHWWIALKTLVCGGFAMNSGRTLEDFGWNQMLSEAMMDVGFDCPLSWYTRFIEYRQAQDAKVPSPTSEQIAASIEEMESP